MPPGAMIKIVVCPSKLEAYRGASPSAILVIFFSICKIIAGLTFCAGSQTSDVDVCYLCGTVHQELVIGQSIGFLLCYLTNSYMFRVVLAKNLMLFLVYKSIFTSSIRLLIKFQSFTEMMPRCVSYFNHVLQKEKKTKNLSWLTESYGFWLTEDFNRKPRHIRRSLLVQKLLQNYYFSLLKVHYIACNGFGFTWLYFI